MLADVLVGKKISNRLKGTAYKAFKTLKWFTDTIINY